MSSGTAPAATEPKLLTAEEFQRRSPEVPEELVRGRIVRMSRPGGVHALTCAKFVRLLGNAAADGNLGTVLCNDGGVVTERDPDTVRGPDIAYYAGVGEAAFSEGYPNFPPTLVVEVRSKNDRRGEIETKVGEYLAAGVPMVCVFDPQRILMAVYRENGVVALGGDDLWTLPELLPGVAARVRDLAIAKIPD